MSKGARELYSDWDYCKERLLHAREVFSNKNSTADDVRIIENELAYMYMYCPEDKSILVLSQLEECGRRLAYFEIRDAEKCLRN